MPNLSVIDEICTAIDNIFVDDRSLQLRYPEAPAARGRSTGELKAFVVDRMGHDRRYAVDERKIRDELGYAPGRDFSSGFTQTLRWYLANEFWWRPLMVNQKR